MRLIERLLDAADYIGSLLMYPIVKLLSDDK